jgi:hypothetical protein
MKFKFVLVFIADVDKIRAMVFSKKLLFNVNECEAITNTDLATTDAHTINLFSSSLLRAPLIIGRHSTVSDTSATSYLTSTGFSADKTAEPAARGSVTTTVSQNATSLYLWFSSHALRHYATLAVESSYHNKHLREISLSEVLCCCVASCVLWTSSSHNLTCGRYS